MAATTHLTDEDQTERPLWRQLMQMSGLARNGELIAVIYSMLWMPFMIAVILQPTHLATADSSVSAQQQSRQTRLPRRQARLSALSDTVKQSRRDGVALAFCLSLKRCRTGPSGCRWSERNLSSAVVGDPSGFCCVSPGEIQMAVLHWLHICHR